MAEDYLARVKLSTGEIGRIGDVGKTAIKPLTPDITADNMEVNFFYAVSAQQSPPITKTVSKEKEPESRTVVYKAGDLL